MAADVVPALMERIKAEFERRTENDPTIRRIAERIKAGTATQYDAHTYSKSVGLCLAETLTDVLTPESLPEGKLFYNIADRTVYPMIKNNHALSQSVALDIQRQIDRGDGIGLQAVAAMFPEDRVRDLIDKMVEASDRNGMAGAEKWIQEPVVNVSTSFFDDFVRENAKIRSAAGLESEIIRIADAGCCPWCSALAGRYDYTQTKGSNVYRRHEYCRCMVTFSSGKKRQNVWSKRIWADDQAVLNERATRDAEVMRLTPEQIREREEIISRDAEIAILMRTRGMSRAKARAEVNRRRRAGR